MTQTASTTNEPSAALPRRPLGDTGLEVTPLGLGAGPLGDAHVDEGAAERLVHAAVDLGLGLIDTAPAYGASEARLGRFLGSRRRRIVLSTKVGYGVEGFEDWTGRCIAAGVERALRVLHTDWLDVVHLHSCPLEVLRRDDVLRSLEGAVRDGKVRVAAYSGEEDELEHAVGSGCFRAVQVSVSPWDQRSLRERLPAFRRAGVGVVAKRALANAPWRDRGRPEAPDRAAYHDRWKVLELDPGGLPWPELCLRFAAHAGPVDCTLVGTRSVAHLEEAIRAVARGPVPDELERAIASAWDARGAAWPGVV